MVFIDYQNFNINLQYHYKENGIDRTTVKSINYHMLAREIDKKLPFYSQVMKTYL